MRFFLAIALALSRSFLGLNFSAFDFALSHSRAPCFSLWYICIYILWKEAQREVRQHWFIDSYIAAYIQP
jgi:hypothetical protein